jgi:hypothetical protein
VWSAHHKARHPLPISVMSCSTRDTSASGAGRMRASGCSEDVEMQPMPIVELYRSCVNHGAAYFGTQKNSHGMFITLTHQLRILSGTTDILKLVPRKNKR